MYSYFYQDHGSAKKLILKSEKGASLVLLPMYGGNIQKVMLPHNEKLVQVTDYYPDEDSLLDLKQSKGIKMLPFPNRVKDGKYSFEGNDYQFVINKPNENNAIHGLLSKALFDVAFIDCNDYRAFTTLRYEYNHQYSSYPFSFLVEISYILSGDGVQIETILKNTGEENLPIGDGWHPYFCINNKPIDKLELLIPSTNILEVDDSMIPTGNKVNNNQFESLKLIGNAKLDDCFEITSKPGHVETILADRSENLKLVVWQNTGESKYNYVQLYTPPERKAIAIEPMTCAPNAFNNLMGLKILKPNETLALSFGFYLADLE